LKSPYLTRHRGSDTKEEPYNKTQTSLDPDNNTTLHRKAFRIKVRGASSFQQDEHSNQEDSSRRESAAAAAANKQSVVERGQSLGDAQSRGLSEAQSFVEQVRKKFKEQRYMKREDVLKLLKQMQGSE